MLCGGGWRAVSEGRRGGRGESRGEPFEGDNLKDIKGVRSHKCFQTLSYFVCGSQISFSFSRKSCLIR